MTLGPLTLSATTTAIVAKLFLNVARSLGPPQAQCNYWLGVLYDLVQNLASNHDLIGKRRP